MSAPLSPKIFSGPTGFLKSAPSLEYLPDADVPEIAFAGRSNVGKSTLINAMVNRNGLARTSNTPGRTQELNFFNVGDPVIFRICDMPGYGYAKAPIKTVAKWRALVNDYLRGRATLTRAFVLIDARRGVGAVDEEVMAMLDAAAVSYQIAITKADKLKDKALEAVTAKVADALRKRPAAHPELIVTSAEKRAGIDALRRAAIDAVTHVRA